MKTLNVFLMVSLSAANALLAQVVADGATNVLSITVGKDGYEGSL
jgi:hypothetical protein